MSEQTRTPQMTAPTRDTHTTWTANNPIIPEGVLCITKNRLYTGSVEYFVGDGTHTYIELEKFGCIWGADGKIPADKLPIIPVDKLPIIPVDKLPTRILTAEPTVSDLSENEIVYVVEA